MRKAILLAAAVVVSFLAYAADAPAPLAKEGSISHVNVLSGAMKLMALGKQRAQVSYELMGAATSPTGQGLLDSSSIRCIGGFQMVNGTWDNNNGSCVYTRPDGDQVFMIYTDSGKVGAPVKGTFTFVGGTGKMAGIIGSGEFARIAARPAAEGTYQSVSRFTGKYRLP